MDIVQLKKLFDEQGYIVMEEFFSDEELADILPIMEEYEARVLNDKQYESDYLDSHFPEEFKQFETRAVNFGYESSQKPAFIELGNNDRMNQLTEAIVGKGYRNQAILVMLSTHGNGQGWHRDCEDENPNYYTINRLIYSKDIDPKAGALYVVPGSHKLDSFPSGGMHDFIEGEVRIAPKKGTLVLVHSSTFHRVNKNETDNPRASINYRVLPEGAPSDLGSVGVYRAGNWDFDKQKMV